jgi:hypothetical protein
VTGRTGRTGTSGKEGKAGSWSGRWQGTLAASLLLGACLGPRQTLRDDSGPSPIADGFELTLNNRHWLDINVFVQHDGESSRVTMVTASTSQSLILPLWMLGESKLVRIIAEPVGEQDSYTTDLLRVDLGQSVEVNVESVLSKSNYSIQ